MSLDEQTYWLVAGMAVMGVAEIIFPKLYRWFWHPKRERFRGYIHFWTGPDDHGHNPR